MQGGVVQQLQCRGKRLLPRLDLRGSGMGNAVLRSRPELDLQNGGRQVQHRRRLLWWPGSCMPRVFPLVERMQGYEVGTLKPFSFLLSHVLCNNATPIHGSLPRVSCASVCSTATRSCSTLRTSMVRRRVCTCTTYARSLHKAFKEHAKRRYIGVQ